MNSVVIMLIIIVPWMVLANIIWEFTVKYGNNVWEYGICRGRQARRNKFNGKVYMMMRDQWNNTHWYLFSLRAWPEFRLNLK